MENFLQNPHSFYNRILRLVFLLMAGYLTTMLAFTLIVAISTAFRPGGIPSTATDLLQDVGLIWTLQTLQTVFFFVLPPILLLRWLHLRPAAFLSLRRPSWSAVLAGVGGIVVMLPLLNLLVEWNKGLHLPDFLSGVEAWMRHSEDMAAQVTDRLMSVNDLPGLAMNLLVVAVMAGFGEEFFFRGLLQRIVSDGLGTRRGGTCSRRSMHLSIWIVAFLFSAMHLQFFGFFPRLLLGAWLGYLMWWSGSVWVPILAHFTNNALSTLARYADTQGFSSEQMDSIGTGNTAWLSVLSVLLLAGLVVFLQKKSHRHH